ncbi:hypothetical protein F5148DRAFT_1145748 [Russula earlei]|uniref:Uncharacterized protein n=1 Tax=Russula earlei TaxID=71964 RepID=A0ACC0UPG5_9AGAM|nr:hypothetical protein F5148DRAFT_1145748 [Russula earlei]
MAITDLLASYHALSASSPRAEVSKVLNTIINAHFIDDANRESVTLVPVLLSDIGSCKPGGTSGKLHHTDAHLALSAIKASGRHPSGSTILALDNNLSSLLAASKTIEDSNLEASLEALRRIANALLVESARATLISDSKSSSPDVVFIASRILFLATASSLTSGSFIISIVERKSSVRTHSLVDIIGLRLGVPHRRSPQRYWDRSRGDCRYLKFAFNILTDYPKLVDCEKVIETGSSNEGLKVMGEYRSDRLDGLASDSSRDTSRPHGAFERAKSMLTAGRRSLFLTCRDHANPKHTGLRSIAGEWCQSRACKDSADDQLFDHQLVD